VNSDDAFDAGNGPLHEVVLRDGSRAVIRPIRPEDRDRLQAGLARLSERSRYLRFHAPVRRLSPEQLRYLTEVDGVDHVAWVALDPDDPSEPGMGVARYVRLPGEPTVAEAAVTVQDRYQGRGLGTLLLELLSRSAVANGIETLRNYVLAENTAMLEVFDALGASRVDEGGGVYRVDMALMGKPEEPTDEVVRKGPAYRVLREVAGGRLPALRWTVLTDWRRSLEEALHLPRSREGGDDGEQGDTS
jgi:RimJ/RimL family protein N-acetyltransferase